jgi:hypothetical protein
MSSLKTANPNTFCCTVLYASFAHLTANGKRFRSSPIIITSAEFRAASEPKLARDIPTSALSSDDASFALSLTTASVERSGFVASRYSTAYTLLSCVSSGLTISKFRDDATGRATERTSPVSSTVFFTPEARSSSRISNAPSRIFSETRI